MRYAVVIENAGSNFSAYVPDLPGCVAPHTPPRKSRFPISTPLCLNKAYVVVM